MVYSVGSAYNNLNRNTERIHFKEDIKMMNKKRGMASILAAMLTIGTLAGCSSANNDNNSTSGSNSKDASSSNQEEVVLKVWGGVPEEAGPVKSIEEFNEKFKDQGIQAEYVRFVNDDTGNLKLETTLLSGEGVDVFITYGLTHLQKRVDGNMALDLTEYCEKDSINLEESFGNLVNSFEIDGKVYCIPSKVDLYGMVLNLDMFEEAGIAVPESWTYSEFREIAKKLTKGEGDSKVYGAFFNTQQDSLMMLGSFGTQAMGGDWMYKEGVTETNFDDPVVKQSIQLYYDMMNVDQSAPTHTDSVTQKLTQEGMFLTGKSAMTVGPWMVRSIKDTENYPHDFKTGFAPYPVPDDVEATYSQGNAGDLISINAKTKAPDAAWEYVKWYAMEGMMPMAEGGRVPLYTGYDTEEVTKAFIGDQADLLDETTVKSILINPRENYAIQTITTKAPELTQIVKEEVEAILNDKKTIDEGISDMKERGDELLAQ